MKAKLVVSYLTQLYLSVISIILMPFYFHHLGAESFGLVGFHIMLQAWIPIFDIGLTPVLSREMSRFRAGLLTVEEAAARLRTLEVVFGGLGLIALVLVWFGSSWIGHRWLSAVTLPEEMLALCILFMGLTVVLRWFAGLQRAVLVGLEYQGLVNGLTAIFATLRFVGVVPLLIFVSTSPKYFFLFQVIVGTLELIVFVVIAHHFLPGTIGVKPDWRVFANMLPMIGSMAFLTAMWVVMTQVDKLILSGLLPLTEYGYFSMAVAAASGVLVLVAPLNQVVQPRLIICAESRDESSLERLYRSASQFAVVGFVSLGGGVAFFAEPILLIWSGSHVVATAAAPVLFWYGLANAVVGILVLPFMLQFAKGRLRLHVLGNLILLVTLVPALVLAAQNRGAAGAGQVFFVVNLLFLLLWIPLVHRHFMPILTWRWSLNDTLPIVIVMVVLLATASQVLPDGLDNLERLMSIVGILVITTIVGVLVGNMSRPAVLRLFFGTGNDNSAC